MNKTQYFTLIQNMEKNELIELISKAYDTMSTDQLNCVFSKLRKKVTQLKVDPREALKQAKRFLKGSLNGVYYAPFNVNSKNYMNVPEETDQWFEELHDLFVSATQLTNQKQYDTAIEIFKIGYQLIEKMESGEDIIFAEEYGMWMFPGDEKKHEKAYFTALLSIGDDGKFVEEALRLLKNDSHQSFTNKTYETIQDLCKDNQIAKITSEAERHNIRLESAH